MSLFDFNLSVEGSFRLILTERTSGGLQQAGINTWFLLIHYITQLSERDTTSINFLSICNNMKIDSFYFALIIYVYTTKTKNVFYVSIL